MDHLPPNNPTSLRQSYRNWTTVIPTRISTVRSRIYIFHKPFCVRGSCKHKNSEIYLTHSTQPVLQIIVLRCMATWVSLYIDRDWELDRKSIALRNQLGIGEFGPIYDAELQLGVNAVSRAVVKVSLVMHTDSQVGVLITLCVYIIAFLLVCRCFNRVPLRTWFVSEKKLRKSSMTVCM